MAWMSMAQRALRGPHAPHMSRVSNGPYSELVAGAVRLAFNDPAELDALAAAMKGEAAWLRGVQEAKKDNGD